jgi:hypothetical protein
VINNSKQHIVTVLVSLTFLPLYFIGLIGGAITGEFFIWFMNYFSQYPVTGWIAVISAHYLAGHVAGSFCGFIINKIYKQLILITALIVPAIFIAVAIFLDVSYAFKNGFDLEFLGHIVRNPVIFICYYIKLSDR